MFKKYLSQIILALVLFAFGLSIYGCGQSNPTVNTSHPQPDNLTIRGTIYGLTVDQNVGDPLEGVTVILSGGQVQATGVGAASASDTWITVTDANGEYAFIDVPANAPITGTGYNIVTTKEGYQRTITPGVGFGGLNQPPDNSIITVDINMDGDPVVLSIDPAPGTTIEAAAQTFTVQFNEAMDPSTVRPILVNQGMRIYAIADTQTLTTAWSADNKTLSITTGALSPNKSYQLVLDPSAIAADASGYRLETTPPTNSGGLDNTTYNQTTATLRYRTASGGVPGAPTGVLLTVNNVVAPDYANAVSGGNADLAWLAPSSGEISMYRVYASLASSGPWMYLGGVSVNTFSISLTNLNTALYGGMYDASCLKELAFVTDPVYFKVAAYNSEGEVASTAVSTRDAVKPTLTSADRTPAVVGIPGALQAAFTDYSAAGADQNLGCYLRFSEPMDPSTLTDTSKYTSSAGQTVTSATLVYNNAGVCVVRLTFDSVIAAAFDTITVAQDGPTDISGNYMGSPNTRTMN